ncbi:MAG: hypothetical protein RSD14_02440 [Clostridia bacterium]
MDMQKQENKVVLLSILGICFGFLGWSEIMSDFTYKKFSGLENIVFIISLLSLVHALTCVTANLIVIKMSHKNPQKLFNSLLLLNAIAVVFVGISALYNNIYLFATCYIVYMIFSELLSMSHFAYQTSVTEEGRFIAVQNKRFTLFKIIICMSTILSNLIVIKYMDFGFFLTTILSSITFLFVYFNIRQIKCRTITQVVKEEPFLQKLNFTKYSSVIKRYGLATMITRFALANIIILFSIHLLQNNMEFSLLKEIKNYAVGFAIMAYFVVKKVNMKGIEIKTTIFLEIMIIALIGLSIWNPLFLILLTGIYTIDNLVELTGRFKIFEKDTYPEKNIEKNSIMDIGLFGIQALSSIILLNIPFNIAISIIVLAMVAAIILKIRCEWDNSYRKSRNSEKSV